MRLKGKTALVTAAGSGIGRATALAFHKEGAVVSATDIDADALASLGAEAEGMRAAILDVRNGADIERFFSDSGRLDVLFNCAGIVPGGTIVDSSISDF